MTNTTKTGLSRRNFMVAGAALAAPAFLPRHAWAQGRTLEILTYTGQQGQYIRESVIPAFQEEYGCRVLQTEGVTLTNIAQIRTQKNNPRYSVAFMDDAGIPIAKAENLIVQLSADQIPNLANVHPNFVYRENYGVAFSVSMCVPWFNPMSGVVIESYADLWKPEFAGRFMMITPKTTNSIGLVVTAAALKSGKPLMEAQYDIETAWDKMAELRPNVQTIYDNAGQAVLQVSQGQADIGGLDYSKSIWPYVDNGAPVELVRPAEGAFAGVNAMTIAADAPEPELAAAFLNTMLSSEVQIGLADLISAAPPVMGLDLPEKIRARTPVDEELSSLHVLDWDFINPRRNAMIEKFNETFSA